MIYQCCENLIYDRGNANLFVRKSEVLSAEATLSNLISLDSTFSSPTRMDYNEQREL